MSDRERETLDDIERSIIRLGAKCDGGHYRKPDHSALACWKCSGTMVNASVASDLRELLTEYREALRSLAPGEARPEPPSAEDLTAAEMEEFNRLADEYERAAMLSERAQANEHAGTVEVDSASDECEAARDTLAAWVVERLRSLVPGEARPEPDHAAMDLLRKLAAEVGASGWHYEDGVLERCTVGGTADPAQAILLSFDSIDGQAKPRRFSAETDEAIRVLPGLLLTLREDLEHIRNAAREPSQQNDGWRPIESDQPPLYVDVIWLTDDNRVIPGYRNHAGAATTLGQFSSLCGKPIKWQPLPPAPPEHEQNETERAE